MKTNLSNRPKRVFSSVRGVIQARETVTKMEHWFERFEKEIQSEINLQSKGITVPQLSEGNQLFCKGYVHALNEILGLVDKSKQPEEKYEVPRL